MKKENESVSVQFYKTMEECGKAFAAGFEKGMQEKHEKDVVIRERIRKAIEVEKELPSNWKL